MDSRIQKPIQKYLRSLGLTILIELTVNSNESVQASKKNLDINIWDARSSSSKNVSTREQNRD